MGTDYPEQSTLSSPGENPREHREPDAPGQLERGADDAMHSADPEVPDYSGLDFKQLLAVAPLEGIDLSRSKEPPRNIEF